MDNTRIPKKKYWKKNFIKEHVWEDHGCDGKTTSEGRLVAVDYNRKEEASRGQQYLEMYYWWGEGLIWMVAPIKEEEEEEEEEQMVMMMMMMMMTTTTMMMKAVV